MSSVLPKFDKGSESKQSTVNCEGHLLNSSTSHGNTNISTNVPATSTNSSSSFYRGVSSSQQPIFSPIIATHNQNYYNGVYCSQTGYANPASVPSPNFSGFSYDSAPWTHEGHLSMHSSTLSAENIRNLSAPLTDKSVLNYSNASHTCCLNKIASGEGISPSSPLTSGVYKTSGKEMEQHNKIGINSDSQLCFMNLSQQTQNSTLSMYKCSEQVSPSSLSQMNLFSIESYDFKYSSEMPTLPNVSEVVQKNTRSPANVGKQVPSKYCHVPKVSSGESQGYDQTPMLDFKQQEQCAYSSQTSNYSSESHLETYYLQGPFPFTVDTSQTHYPPQRHTNGHEESIYLSSKTFPSPSLDSQVGIGARSLCHGDRPRALLDSNMSADLVRLESYLHVDSKHVVSPCSQDGFHSGKQFDHDFQQATFPSISHHLVGSQFPQLSNCVQIADGLKINSRPSNGDNVDCEILDSVNGKDIDVLESEDSSTQESLSIAEEDDIIVEEEIEDPKEKSTIEEEGVEKALSPSVKDCSKRCLVCDTYHVPSLQAFILIPIKADSPVTSVSCLPVAAKLSHILLRKSGSSEEENLKDNDVQISKKFHGEYLCGQCLSLVERADDLEVKLGVIYQDLQCLYKRTTSLRRGNSIVNTEVCDPIRKAIHPVSFFPTNDDAKKDETLQRNEQVSAVVLSDTDPLNESQRRKDVEVLNDSTMESFDLNGNIKTGTLLEIETDQKYTKGDEKQEMENIIILEKLQCNLAQSETKKLESNKQERLDKKFVCDVCDMKFSRKESMVKHMQIHTGDFSFRCEHCKKGFSRRGALARHIISRHNSDKDRHLFQCEQCGKRFTQEHHLQVHLQSHRGELPHLCEQCGKGFASQYSLSIHKRTHSGERPFPCKYCGRTFTTCSNLKAHATICPKNCQAKEPKPPKPLNHYCSYCKKGFAKPSDLKVHLRSHTGEKPYVCERCGKRFCNSGNYNQHARSHCNAVSLTEGEEQKSIEDEVGEALENGEQGVSSQNVKLEKSRPFKCKVCNKGFPRKGALTAHENRHKGLKPFVCDTCGKAFPDRSNLHNHKLLHSSVKPHRCDVCGKSIRSSLKVHMRTHTGEKPYSCSICKQKFAVNSSLTVHLRKHHDIDSNRSLSP